MEKNLEALKMELEKNIEEYKKILELQEQFIQSAGLQKQFQEFTEEKKAEMEAEKQPEHHVEYQRSLAEQMHAAAEEQEDLDKNCEMEYPADYNENQKQAKKPRRY